MIHELRKDFKLAIILEATRFPKATYMYWQKRFNRRNKNEEIEKQIEEIFKENDGNYGYRRIQSELRNRGVLVNSKKVRRIMRKLGIKCIAFTRKSRKYSTYKGAIGKVAKNLVRRHFKTDIPYQKLTTDTTEFKYHETDKNGTVVIKKAYLDPFLDMFNSEIISFRVSKKPNVQAIREALMEAIDKSNDCLYRRTIHSDQGWAYQMKSYCQILQKNKIFQSMSRKGSCLDNSPMENFFSVMKQEMYYGKVYKSFEELKGAIKRYIHYYNHNRIKSKLDWRSPVDYRLLKEQKIS